MGNRCTISELDFARHLGNTLLFLCCILHGIWVIDVLFLCCILHGIRGLDVLFLCCILHGIWGIDHNFCVVFCTVFEEQITIFVLYFA